MNSFLYLEDPFAKDFKADAEGITYNLYTINIGKLRIDSGKIIACDPLLFWGDQPFTEVFPMGYFDVELAIAQIKDDERVAFARIKFINEQPIKWEQAVTDGQDLSKLADAEFYGYGVDSGTGGSMDLNSAKLYEKISKEDVDNVYFEQITDAMSKNYTDTRDWIIWNEDNLSIAMFSSGYGDGIYPTYIGYASTGAISRLTTDFLLF